MLQRPRAKQEEASVPRMGRTEAPSGLHMKTAFPRDTARSSEAFSVS